jgi:transposase InsO family protein
VVKLRREFVLKALSRDASMSELCREYGISRKTGYKWIERFQQGGVAELIDNSRRPSGNSLQITAEVTLEILQLRRAHPSWGPRKIRRLLERKLEPGTEAPSVRTIARVLERGHLARKRQRRRPRDHGWTLQRGRKQVVVAEPNDLWTVDFKGWWLAKDGSRCDPLTIRDAYSRYVLALRILPSTDGKQVRRVFEELFERYGLPKAIQSDNGSPFATTRSLCGVTPLSVWWLSLGIEVVRSRPGCPQDNGAHERMHGDIRVELQADASSSTATQQAACDAWCVEFNHVRPHDALDLKTPAEVYRPSPRRLRHLVGGFFPENCDVVALDRRGGFVYDGQRVFVSKVLGGLGVGLEPPQKGDDGQVTVRVWFHRLLMGFFNLGTGQPEVSVEPFLPPEPRRRSARAPAPGEQASASGNTNDATRGNTLPPTENKGNGEGGKQNL